MAKRKSAASPPTPKGKGKNQENKRRAWRDGEGPNRDQIVQGLRTLHSLGSCWLDRDPNVRGRDPKQLAQLEGILALLMQVEVEQREVMARVLATGVKDVLAVALGAPVERGEDGQVRIAHRAAESPGRPAVVPTALQSGSSMAGDPVVQVFENAAWHHELFTGQPSVSFEKLQEVAAQAIDARKRARRDDGRDHASAHEAACMAALHLVVDGTYSKDPASATTLFKRWLDVERHPDRPGSDGVDLGLYFGAPSTQIPGPGGPYSVDARAESAATLAAEVFGVDVEVARALWTADAGWPGLWQLAARGRGTSSEASGPGAEPQQVQPDSATNSTKNPAKT